jgi:hypothetical protein
MENKWLKTFYEKLESNGVSKESVELLSEKYGEQLSNASYSTTTDNGMAYDGSLVEMALKKLTVYALKVNELYPEDLRADTKSIVKVCLLSHISKAVRTEKSNNEWRIKNLGEAYTYVKGMPAIGTGLHSLAIATECGVTFTPTEVEAMTINDRANDDLQAKYHCSMLSSIIRQANEMVYVEANERK